MASRTAAAIDAFWSRVPVRTGVHPRSHHPTGRLAKPARSAVKRGRCGRRGGPARHWPSSGPTSAISDQRRMNRPGFLGGSGVPRVEWRWISGFLCHLMRGKWHGTTGVAGSVSSRGTTRDAAWVAQAEIDAGDRPRMATSDAARIAELEREIRELRRSNAIVAVEPPMTATCCPLCSGRATSSFSELRAPRGSRLMSTPRPSSTSTP